MKKNLLKTALFISIIIGMNYFSCTTDSFTEQDAMKLQSQLDREKTLLQDSLDKANTLMTDSLNKIHEQITYTLSIIDAAKTTTVVSGGKGSGGGDTKGGLTGATATMTQGGTVTTLTSGATGVVVFKNLQPGIATLHVVLTGYSEINAVLDFSSYGVGTSVSGGIQLGNVMPMIPLSGASTGTIKGTVVCESDLTNKVPEAVPTGTVVIATVDPGSAALSGIVTGKIVSLYYDNLSLQATTDATGAFTMTVPGTSMGLDYNLRVSDFTVNQSLLMLTKGGVAVTGVQTVPTTFGSDYYTGSSTVPTVNAVIVAIGAPDYTYTAATATAVVSNVNGLNYIALTYAGNYYYYYGSAYTNIPIDNPSTGTGGTPGSLNFTVNSFGQVTSATIFSTGSGYSTSVDGATFTMPYIRTAAVATVQTVNGTGGITSWKITTAGQFFSISNIDFFRSSGTGTGASLTLPAPVTSSSGLSFSTAPTYTPSSPLGSGYVVGDQFTLNTKTGMSDPMTGTIHMTTGSVTAINITAEGTNYISGKVDVNIASPGVTGTTATATASVVNGKISAITITNNGSNYSSTPAVTIVNRVEKIQAMATATVNANGNITGFTVTNNGNGYLSVPAVTLTPSVTGMGSGASAVAVLSGATVGSLSLIYGGSGYLGVNTPATVQNSPSSTYVSVNGSATTITYINLGTGKRSIEN